ncbi:MAG: hypothetical protein ACREK2_02440 [Gemmatimonadota bacterium]
MGSKWLNPGIVSGAALFAAAVCGTPDEDAPGNGSLSDTVPAVDFAAEAPGGVTGVSADPATGRRVVRAELEALGGTDVIGSVSLTPGEGGTAVSVEIHGANSGLPYVAELVGGSCGAPAAVIAVLGEITAGEEGDGAFHEVLDPSLLGGEQANRAVRVRGAGDTGAIVACGNLMNAAP